mmetsp:Transcript_42406/g.107001  ORF Transcript_42406/g.107001 Transcript_42406/m.107001 type:complete len:324 (-) Transcript_42406:29-1000(-)
MEISLLHVLTSIVVCIATSYLSLLWLTPRSRGRTHNESRYFDPVNQQKTVFPSLDEPPTVDLSLVIPAYNEVDRLPITMEKTLAYLDQRCKNELFTFEIIIVDDGSKDRTYEVAMRFVKSRSTHMIRVMRLEKNRGKGGAVTQGMLVARGKLILMMDADAATEIEDLNKLEERLQEVVGEDRLAMAVGSRAHLVDTDAVVKRSAFRNFLMRGFHLLVYMLGVRHVRDTQCGFKLFTRRAALGVFRNMHVEGWIFDIEMLLIGHRLGIPVVEVPVNWQEIAGSKVDPLLDSVRMAKDLLLIRLNYTLGRWRVTPLQSLEASRSF